MKNYSKTYEAPARRNRLAVAAFQRSGAGIHRDTRPEAGPSADEWDDCWADDSEEQFVSDLLWEDHP